MITTILNGTLGRDAEVRDAGDTKVINFSVAVNIGYGEKKKTLWVECAKFGNNTKVAEYLTKGTNVAVSGEPDIRSYLTKSGEAGASMTLRVNNVELLGGGNKEQQPVQNSTPTKADDFDADSDLPF